MPVACGIRSQTAELHHAATYGTQPPQTGTGGQLWDQSQAAASAGWSDDYLHKVLAAYHLEAIALAKAANA